jgi:hypothetical protein
MIIQRQAMLLFKIRVSLMVQVLQEGLQNKTQKAKKITKKCFLMPCAKLSFI